MSLNNLIGSRKGVMRVETLVIFVSMILVAGVAAFFLMSKSGLF